MNGSMLLFISKSTKLIMVIEQLKFISLKLNLNQTKYFISTLD